MTKYEFYVPPVREWPGRYVAGFKMLMNVMLLNTWRDMKAVRRWEW